MTAITASQKSGWQGENNEAIGEEVKVPLESLSELTGFPVEFIKKELLLEEESLSMAELRASMVRYLESTAGELNP